ncbi:MAG: glycosyltransferase [Planctomycetes bacterium]|nr:glycosyltransferase [Planctomycetota bacterium]
MRICHVTDFLPGLHRIAGGAEHAVKRVLDEQAALGLEVQVVTATRELEGPAALGFPHRRMRRIDRLAPRLSYALKSLYFPFDPLAARDLRAALRELAPDVVHFHNLHFCTPSIIREASRLGLPTVMTIYDYWLLCPSFMLLTADGRLCDRGHGAHCVDCVGARRARALRPLKRFLFGARKPTFERALAAVDRLVVLSQASKELLVRHGTHAERVHVVPQYLWQAAAERPLPPPAPPGALLYVGWIEGRKGLHVVLEAMAMLAERHPTLHLTVHGRCLAPEYRQKIDATIARARLADRVTFAGPADRDGLLAAFDRASLVVIPEQWANMSPVILTEAMAAGKCVLASRVGGIPEFVEDRRSGLLAERDSPAEFAERIEWAMQNPAAVHALGAAARERAAAVFDAARINARWLDLYRSLTRPGSVSPRGDAGPRDGT